jgi:hypothetical protein
MALTCVALAATLSKADHRLERDGSILSFTVGARYGEAGRRDVLLRPDSPESSLVSMLLAGRAGSPTAGSVVSYT